MSRRRRATLSPSLFPFLAVLICTLGTLILLLALVAQKADETAEQAAREKAAHQLDSRQVIAKQQWLRDEIVSLRDKQTGMLERRRSELAHLEERERKLLQELKRLKSEIDAAEQPAVETSQQQMVISALKEQIESEREKVAQLKAEVSGRRPRVIITAHDGPYGTERRPIYVECTADGLVLQPEGSRIELGQLAGAIGPGNPLDAALRTVRLYWQKTEPQSPAPYPLLVVRPDGIATYAAARRAMASWDDQFGYELVPAELELAFPKADQRLRREIDLAVRDAASRQDARIASARRSTGHGFSGRGQPRVLSAASLSRSGSGGRHFSRAVDPQETAGGSGIHPDDIREFDDAMKSAAARSPLGGSPGSQANELPGSGVPGSQVEEQRSAAAETATAGGKSHIGGSADAQDDLHVEWSDDSFGNGGSTGEDGSSRDGGSSDGQGNGDPQALSQSALSSGQSGSGGPNAGGSAASAQANNANSNDANQQPTSTANAAIQSSSASKQRLRRNGSEWALPDNVRRTRGSAIERRIDLSCRGDGFVLAPERAGLAAREFPIGDGTVDDAVMELAAVVHDRVESWGVALASGRWQPILRVTVHPGAERRFHELQTLLGGSGLNIEQR